MLRMLVVVPVGGVDLVQVLVLVPTTTNGMATVGGAMAVLGTCDLVMGILPSPASRVVVVLLRGGVGVEVTFRCS